MQKFMIAAALLVAVAFNTAAQAQIATPQDYANAAAYAKAYEQAAQNVGDSNSVGGCYSQPAPGSYNYGKCRFVRSAMDRKVDSDRGNSGGGQAPSAK